MFRTRRTGAAKVKKVPDGRGQERFPDLFVLSVKHSVMHRPMIGENAKKNKERNEPRIFGTT